MRLVRPLPLGLGLALALASVPASKPPEPPAVVVQHILVGFKGSVTGKAIERKKAEAEALAARLLERARAGDDFDALVREFTDDRYPGIYALTNKDAPRRSGARPRDQMVPGFGNVAFRLTVGEVGVAPYHGVNSPYGWHVIKRLE